VFQKNDDMVGVERPTVNAGHHRGNDASVGSRMPAEVNNASNTNMVTYFES